MVKLHIAFSIYFLALFYLERYVIVAKNEILETTTDIFLYDLASDPFESTNVLYENLYSENVIYFEEQRSYWYNYTIEPNIPNYANMTEEWDSCGRVCPWINSSYSPLYVAKIYDETDVPNIVFVLVDDWGYNDFGLRSTYLNWTTPTIDSLAQEGILLQNYYTNELCSPSRASFLTGRYSLRLGVYTTSNELPTSEVTLAEELKTAGYRTYIIGKWHLGQSEYKYLPRQRGFDYFYGYLNGYQTYYSKEYRGYVDLWENNDYVTDKTSLDSSYHAAYLYEDKAENAIMEHAMYYSDLPMFLYYPMHLVHYPWTAPQTYIDRCVANSTLYVEDDDAGTEVSDNTLVNYCAMMVMMDEAIGNLTCALSKYGFSDNTILIISGDNGGESGISGSNYPYKGHKATANQGAFANTAIIHSKLIPVSRRGGTYNYNVHITDWYPTFMGLATNNEWTGGYKSQTIDGVDIWKNVVHNSPSERDEIVFISRLDEMFAMQSYDMKYIFHINDSSITEPENYFDKDLSPSESSISCPNPSFVKVSRLGDEVEEEEDEKEINGSTLKNEANVTFIFFAFVITVTIFCLGLILTIRSTAVNESKQISADIYSAYKYEEIISETSPLMSKI